MASGKTLDLSRPSFLPPGKSTAWGLGSPKAVRCQAGSWARADRGASEVGAPTLQEREESDSTRPESLDRKLGGGGGSNKVGSN